MVDFKSLRKKSGLTQAELAERVGVSENTIQNWESHKIIPKGENLNNYLRELGITDQAELKRIISELTEAAYIKDLETVDNVPYFLFEDKAEQIDMIKNCYASAEELDMLGYVQYVSRNGKHAKRERRTEENYILDFAFFEKYGGYNVTMKRLHDAGTRLGALLTDAVEYAEQNPGCEYRLVSFDKEKIIEKLGTFTRKENILEHIKDLYLSLITIDSLEKISGSSKNMERIIRINNLLKNASQDMFGERKFGELQGYIKPKDGAQGILNITMMELTERGRLLIEMVDSDEYSIKKEV